MIKTFTQNDLIRFLYQETTERETTEISKALICDAELQQQFNSLNAAKTQLDEARMVPSANVIQNILDYSRGLQEKQ